MSLLNLTILLIPSVGKNVEQLELSLVMVGVEHSTAILERHLAVSYKVTYVNTSALCPSNTILNYFLLTDKDICPRMFTVAPFLFSRKQLKQPSKE